MDSTDNVASKSKIEVKTADKTKSNDQKFDLETVKAFAKKNPLVLGKQNLF